MKMALHKGFYYFYVIHFWSLFDLFPFLFQELKKNALIFEKSRVSSIKVSKIFPLEPYFRVLQIKYLSKCSYFKKPPQGVLPWKIYGYTPDVNQQSITPAKV